MRALRRTFHTVMYQIYNTPAAPFLISIQEEFRPALSPASGRVISGFSGTLGTANDIHEFVELGGAK